MKNALATLLKEGRDFRIDEAAVEQDGGGFSVRAKATFSMFPVWSSALPSAVSGYFATGGGLSRQRTGAIRLAPPERPESAGLGSRGLAQLRAADQLADGL
ncbi:MAG: hypothetical protein IPN20_04885 [Haliscomenobacter sp.]|nr:hypothetical protein [Haliscomenobacter sp.]